MSDELPEENFSRSAHRVDSAGDSSDSSPPPPDVPRNLSTTAVLGSDRTPVLSSDPAEPVFLSSSSAGSASAGQSVSDPVTDFQLSEEAPSLESAVDVEVETQATQSVSDPDNRLTNSEQSSVSIADPSVPYFSQNSFVQPQSSQPLASNLIDPLLPVYNGKSEISVGSAAHPADPEVKEDSVDRSLLAEILELGFEESIAILSIFKTKRVGGVEGAVNWILEHSNESDFESESGEEQAAMGAMPSSLSTFRSHKMVFVANTSLKMGPGKLAAQVGHATLGVYRLAQRTEEGQRALDMWHTVGEMKVVVKGQNTEQLLDMFKLAKDMGLFAYVVADAGRTQIPAGSRTVLGIFGPSDIVDTVTGQLKLL